MVARSNANPKSLNDRIEAAWDKLSAAERRVADHLRQNTGDLLFETGASLARQCGVSEMTVSRVLKKLGCNGFASLKEVLRMSEGLVAVDTKARGSRLSEGHAGVFLKREAEAILEIADLIESPAWARVIAKIHRADEVVVAAFQMVRGEAEDFARRLSLVRPGVRYAATHDGCLTELVTTGAADGQRVLIIIDVLPYARETEAIAAIALEAGYELVFVTDTLNQRARELSDMVLGVRLTSELLIESLAPMACILALIVNEVSNRDPGRAIARMEHWAAIAGQMRYFEGKAAPRLRIKRS